MYPHYIRCEIPYLPPMQYDFPTIAVLSVAISNAILTLIYCDYIENNSISYFVANQYSNLITVLLDQCLSSHILISLDY
jgi:hypothetical protein